MESFRAVSHATARDNRTCVGAGSYTNPEAMPVTRPGASQFRAFVVSSIFLLGAVGLSAQNSDKAAGDQSACEVMKEGKYTPTTPYATLDSDVVLVLRDLDKCLKDGPYSPADLRVFIAGKMLPSLKPTPSPGGQNYVKFRLRIDTSDKDDRSRWADIINDSRRSTLGVSFTVGDLRTGVPFPSQQIIKLVLYPWYTPLILVGLIVLLVCLVILGTRSNLLRDNPTEVQNTNANYPLSLGRVQMAWWFYLVVAAYLYLWLITGQSYTPTGSVLALIGISTATGFAGAVIDRQKNSDLTNKRADLVVQQATLDDRIKDVTAAHPVDGSDLAKDLLAKKDELSKIKAQLAITPAPQIATSKGLLRDIFCDGDGVSFHRFQIIIWSIVLGIVFVNAVHRDLAMPDFDATLLGLMGLSAGTYVGFKFPEKAK
jgi:hypothetical protein